MSAPAEPTTRAALTARTVAIDAPADSLRLLAADGFAWCTDDGIIVTSGIAATVDPDDAVRFLAGLAGTESVAPIACGALGYRSPQPLVVPTYTLRVAADGAATLTTIAPADALDPFDIDTARSHTTEVPRRFIVTTGRDRAAWTRAVDAILDAIATGRVEKAVLAREIFVEADVAFDLPTVIGQLRVAHGGTFVFADRGFVGASPELLVRRRGDQLESRPMAGTVARSGDPVIDDARAAALLASVKNNNEHRFVADAVRHALTPYCDPLVVATQPELVRLTNVAHLVTAVHGTLTTDASALDLARVLHPTPAVNGTPSDAAAAILDEVEGFDRGRYAGPVGWVDASGDGEFAVGLRSAEIDGRQARLFAGAGIVAGSEPESEWQETQAKFEPMLRVLVRP
jgi:menaquinone-specific isochorismate synthase